MIYFHVLLSHIVCTMKRHQPPHLDRRTTTKLFSTTSTAAADAPPFLDPIERQKERAIKFWNESNYDEPMKVQVHEDVMNYLKQGNVFPIFHTLCRDPSKRLFQPNTSVSKNDNKDDMIQLSSESVSAGECDEKSEIGIISKRYEMSYLDAFFASKDTARSNVQDLDGISWNFDPDYTKYLTALVNSPATMVGEDLEVTKLVAPLIVSKEESGLNLITRRFSRGVVADCFEKSQKETTYAIVGNPGVGKSWTLVYALQQALLYENVCVLFWSQKEKKAIACIRRDNKLFAWFCQGTLFGTDCISGTFLNSNVLILLDPRETGKGGAEFAGGSRMLIMAASNHADHFIQVKKETAGYARFLNIYTDEELKVALPYMTDHDESLSDIHEMLERAKEVGNLPRYIVSEEKYNERNQSIDAAIKKISEKDVKDFLEFKGFTEGTATLPGTIFAIKVNLNVWEDGNIPETIYDDRVGYDGEIVYDYGNKYLSIFNKEIEKKIATLDRKDLLSFWAVTSPE